MTGKNRSQALWARRTWEKECTLGKLEGGLQPKNHADKEA